MDGWMDGWMDGRTDGRMDGRTDGRTNGWSDRLDGLAEDGPITTGGHRLIPNSNFT